MFGNISFELLMKQPDTSDWISGRDLESVDLI